MAEHITNRPHTSAAWEETGIGLFRARLAWMATRVSARLPAPRVLKLSRARTPLDTANWLHDVMRREMERDRELWTFLRRHRGVLFVVLCLGAALGVVAAV